MKGIRSALVLLPPDLGADPSNSPFERWLQKAGWDPNLLQLRPSPTHATLGWRACAVDTCDRPAWGRQNNGLCEGCKTQWQARGKPDRGTFDRQPPKRLRMNEHPSACLVSHQGVRCGRDAQNKGLCGPHSFTVMRSTRGREAVIADLRPLPTLGPCRVAACDRTACLPGTRFCKAHGQRWQAFKQANAGADLDDWSRRTKQVTDGRRVFFGGVHPHVRRQILFGVYNRSRRGSRTRLDHLQRLVDWVRWSQMSDLLLQSHPAALAVAQRRRPDTQNDPDDRRVR